MTTFYICRHGQSENNLSQRLSGWIDTPLTDEGIQNAVSAARKLQQQQGGKFGVTGDKLGGGEGGKLGARRASRRIDKIISSDLGRAFMTAYIISRQLGFTDAIECRRELREVNYGDLANMPYADYPAGMSPEENTNYTSPRGESLAHMQQRVMAGIAEIAASNPDKTILLVAHDGTINAVNAIFTNQSIGVLDAIHNPHDFVAKFTYDKGQVLSFEEIGA
jgi:broad specificity phosphatase PhoE